MPSLRSSSVTSGRRQALRLSSDDFVKIEPLPGHDAWPLVITPALPDVDLIGWAEQHRALIDDRLRQAGALLFRGFGIADLGAFERFAEATSTGGLIDYRYASTPRQRLAGRLYTSTEYPPDQVIPPHNEMSYHSAWPLKIWFCCLKPAAVDGATPLCRSADVLAGIAPRIRDRFIEHGVLYVRNYGLGLDLSLTQVFGTDDRGEIETFCQQSGMGYAWRGPTTLVTRQRCQATAVHPRTGQQVWFNQAHLFHVTSLGTEMARELVTQLGDDRLPRQAYYGDGSAIEPDVLDEIRAAYQREQIAFAWELGDVLLLDNMLIAHGRQAYRGDRRIAVAMAEEWSNGQTMPATREANTERLDP